MLFFPLQEMLMLSIAGNVRFFHIAGILMLSIAGNEYAFFTLQEILMLSIAGNEYVFFHIAGNTHAFHCRKTLLPFLGDACLCSPTLQ